MQQTDSLADGQVVTIVLLDPSDEQTLLRSNDKSRDMTIQASITDAAELIWSPQATPHETPQDAPPRPASSADGNPACWSYLNSLGGPQYTQYTAPRCCDVEQFGAEGDMRCCHTSTHSNPAAAKHAG